MIWFDEFNCFFLLIIYSIHSIIYFVRFYLIQPNKSNFDSFKYLIWKYFPFFGECQSKVANYFLPPPKILIQNSNLGGWVTGSWEKEEWGKGGKIWEWTLFGELNKLIMRKGRWKWKSPSFPQLPGAKLPNHCQNRKKWLYFKNLNHFHPKFDPNRIIFIVKFKFCVFI